MSKGVPDARLRSLLDEARALISGGKFAEARTRLLAATHEFSDSADVWTMLGVAEHKLGHLSDAVQDLLASLQIDPDDADALSSLGGVYISMREYDQAERCYQKVVLAEPANTYALLNLLTLHGMKGPIDAELATYRRALDAGKRRCREQMDSGVNLPWCAYDLAQIAFFEKNWPDFEASLRDAISRSAPWQVDSAVKTYGMLAESAGVSLGAQRALDTIGRMRA